MKYLVSPYICHNGIYYMSFKHMPTLTVRVIPLGYNVDA